MTLTNPLFLIALTAILIPIAVHLFQFHRYQKVYFSNVRYLEALQQETRQRRNLRRLLVLACRILAIVCLVLAFCRPVHLRPQQELHAGSTAVSIYVDNSYSMEQDAAEGTLLQQAAQKAKEIAQAYNSTDRFQLITNSMQGVEFQWVDRDEFLSRVEGLTASPATPTMSRMLHRQHDFLRSSHAPECQAYVISDFQTSVADVAQFPDDSTVHTTLVPLSAAAAANVYIDSVAFGSPVFMPGTTVSVEVFLHNSTPRQVESLPVHLYLDGQLCAMDNVDLPAHDKAVAHMQLPLSQAGVRQGRVEVQDHPVTFDDTLFFSLNVQPRVPVYVVTAAAENPYLHRLFAQDSAIAYTHATESHVDYTALSRQHLVVVDGLKYLSSGLAQTLLEFVQEGGTLLLVPSEAADVASYNAALSLFHAPTLGTWRKQELPAASLNRLHRIYRNVFSTQADDMELPATHGTFALHTDATTVKESLITLTDGTDYLCDVPCGKGHLFLFTTPLQTEWTDFVQQALFVPTLYNMALYSRVAAPPYAVLDGEGMLPLSHYYSAQVLPHLTGRQTATDVIPELRNLSGRSYLLLHNLTTAGNYLLRASAEETGAAEPLEEGVSLNYSRRESEMQFLTPAQIEEQVANYHLTHYGTLRGAERRAIDTEIRAQRNGTPLWKYFVVGALLMLLLETLFLRIPLREAPRTSQTGIHDTPSQ